MLGFVAALMQLTGFGLLDYAVLVVAWYDTQ